MPTELERAGDFSQSVDVNGALIRVVDPLSRAPAGNIVPASRLDTNGQALLNVFPKPNFLDTSISKRQYNHVAQWESENPFHLFTFKLDYNISSKNLISGTYTGSPEKNKSPNASGITAPFATFPGGGTAGWGHLAGLRYQRIFSPTLINELTVGYVARYTTSNIGPEALKGMQRDTYGFKAGQFNPANNPLGLVPGMSFGGIVGAASISYDGRFPYDNGRYMYDVGDNITKTLGTHTLKAGFMFERIQQTDGPWATHFNGTFDFGRNTNNPFDSGYAYANAALGVFNSYQEATSRPDPIIFSRGLEWFVQDNWKATRRLTLDYGVRFYWFEPFWTVDNRMAGFVPGAFDPSQQVQLIQPALDAGKRVGKHSVTGEIYPASLIGFIAPGTGNPTNGMVNPAEVSGYPRALVANPGMLPAPRIGFAFDPFGDGKTAIRGSFGVFYSRFLGYISNVGVNGYPIVQTPLVQYGTIATFRTAQGFTSPPSVTAWERNMKASQVMNISLSIQRKIAFGTVLDVGYVGSLGRHLPWARSLQEILWAHASTLRMPTRPIPGLLCQTSSCVHGPATTTSPIAKTPAVPTTTRYRSLPPSALRGRWSSAPPGPGRKRWTSQTEIGEPWRLWFRSGYGTMVSPGLTGRICSK